MTTIEARLCIDEIKLHVGRARAKLLDLYERRGWEALGYGNWRECVVGEFGQSQAYLYRQLEAAQTERNISPIGEIGKIPESQLRPLASLEPAQQREVWAQSVETAPEGKPTAAHVQAVVNDFNYKRDNRHAQAQDIYTPLGMDACQTPAYAIDPLMPYLIPFQTIWEPAAGEGLLVDALSDCTFTKFTVIASDLIEGKNFFEYEPDEWDCLVTNPPYSVKFQWLKRCFELGKPFALLMPIDTLGAKTAQELFELYGIEVMLLNQRVNFKMPVKGWEAGGAQFSTAWFTWGLGLGAQLVFGKLNKPEQNEHN